ncbi:hypothetical protein DHEL01_v204160 [Diaporthe helianthi]|uniref:histidine kinase n=1 Tax=Diaporthe helianthi TaxID=158607 RepID=A0A2P5I4H0_DIAHE|nr:hypothetical protein DHEL01_v204160 [Diaporthe helianthi]
MTQYEALPPKPPASSSTASTSLTNAFAPCYPKSEPSESELRPLPVRPFFVSDDELCGKPISAFNEQLHRACYGLNSDLNLTQRPDGFADPYLMPSLSRNERLRLTMLWYYTRGLDQDRGFVHLLQEKLDLVQAFMEWDFAILGLVSEDIFTRVVASGIPTAVVPRRESTCSHTINQEPGVVFKLPNMASDWRFRASPPVAQGGLRSYAGVPLRCLAPTGEYVALGSLCVASNSADARLTPAQEAALIAFGDILVTDIVNRSRYERRQQRTAMAQRLAESLLGDKDNAETKILDLVREYYPDACVDILEATDDKIPLPRHLPIDVRSIDEGLWEDAEYIDELIRTANFRRINTSRTIRAVAHPCQSFPSQKFLVVASSNVQVVFDDVDSWFIERCATSLATAFQERNLRAAMKAKDQFLRGITHQLRTPIHGVLASCELLAEELAARNELEGGTVAPATYPSSFINTIRDSGKQLMMTVNNILKLNYWSETITPRNHLGLQSLAHLEEDIVHQVKQLVPHQDFSTTPIFFDNRLGSDDYSTVMDPSLLKECLQSLLLNALSNDNDGAVAIVISSPLDKSRLTFDVIDAGCGIPPADQDRIFEAFEKINPHTRGAGLGLTIATKIAASMNGNISLVSSSQEPDTHGSHFRAEFCEPKLTRDACNHSRTLGSLQHIPRQFFIAQAPDQRSQLVLHFASFLENQGFKRVTNRKEAFAVVAYTSDTSKFKTIIDSLEPGQRSVCLTPAGLEDMQDNSVHFLSSPFFSSRLYGVLETLDKAYESQHLNSGTGLSDAAQGLGVEDIHQLSGLRIVPPPTPPPEVDPVALLVDDNMVNLRILQMYCEKRNITYSTAINGIEAVDRFEKSLSDDQPINLILMDLQMPLCDGIEATQRIRNFEAKNTSTAVPSRIFMITGQDTLEDKGRSFSAGADAFYVKPTGIKALDKGISEHFPGFVKKIAPLKPNKAG